MWKEIWNFFFNANLEVVLFLQCFVNRMQSIPVMTVFLLVMMMAVAILLHSNLEQFVGMLSPSNRKI